MKEKEIIKDYGTTVSAEVYINALQGHPYIPQSDQAILNIIKKKAEAVPSRFSVLDVGCGPARLTYRIAHLPIQNNSLVDGIHVTGTDISASFLEDGDKITSDATKVFIGRGHGTRHVDFICADFATGEEMWHKMGGTVSFPKDQDVILMQGVMHHVHESERDAFLNRCFSLLKDDGILIIGDEFIRSYSNEKERVMNVARFYLHIIGEALKGGFKELAREEAKNLIDDVLSGKPGAGFADDAIMEMIFELAKTNNELFYNTGYMPNHDFSYLLFPTLEKRCAELARAGNESFNRGDFKVSTEAFIKEMIHQRAFSLVEEYKFGPVDELGGMAVLVFKKKINNSVTDQPLTQ